LETGVVPPAGQEIGSFEESNLDKARYDEMLVLEEGYIMKEIGV
jgi:hypothetical protein